MKRFVRKPAEPDSSEIITVVSGLPRSGTSMMMRMLEAGGILALTDEIREADRDNPKGYYEFERVKQIDKGDVAWLDDAKGKAVKVITALLKHLPAEYFYRIILMRRDMPEILASQKKMLIRRGEATADLEDQEMGALFERHLNSVESWLRAQSNMSVLAVHYGSILEDPLPQIANVNDFLGGALDIKRMADVVDPDLYRSRQS